MIPYTYLIGWTKYNLWYYGVRYSRNCSPDDLFITYFTSSKLVHQYIKEYGLPNIVQIRKTFKTANPAISWEKKVLRRIDILGETKWLNKNIAGAIYYDDEIREKTSLAKKNNIWVHKNGKKTMIVPELLNTYMQQGYERGTGQNQSGENNSMYGRKHTKKTLEKISKANSRSTLTEEGRKRKSEFMKNNNPMYNKKSKEKLSKTLQQTGTSNKKVQKNGIIYNSIKEANKQFTNIKYSTLWYYCNNKKNGWSFV